MKNTIKKSVSLIMLVLCSFLVYAQTNYNGDIEVNYDGSAKVKISNMENFPIINGVLVYDVVQDGNVIYGGTVDDINIQPKQQYRFMLDFMEPLAAGTYDLDMYFTTPITPVVGVPYLFAGPVKTSFTVSEGTRPGVVIGKSSYLQAPQYTGQLGATAKPGAEVKGVVKLTGTISGTFVVTGCIWDDSTCDSPVVLYSSPIDISGSTDKEFEFTAPSKPGVYSIRFEVKDNIGTVALYRNRLMVSGESAKIRILKVDSLDGSGTMTVTSSGSVTPSDDVTATLSVTVGEFKDSKEITIPSNQLITESFIFHADVQNSYQICAELKSDTVLDSFCYDVDQKKFGAPITMDVQGSSIELCSNGDATDVQYIVIDSSGIIIDRGDTLALTPCSKKELSLSAGDYVVALQDLNNEEDYEFKFTVAGQPERPVETIKTEKDISTFLVIAFVALAVLAIALFLKFRRQAK